MAEVRDPDPDFNLSLPRPVLSRNNRNIFQYHTEVNKSNYNISTDSSICAAR